MKWSYVLSASAAALVAASASAQVMLVTDSTNKRVMQFDAFDGSLINADFIVDPDHLSTPINAIWVRNEVWVSDQIRDGVFRYNARGSFLGQFNSGGLDDVRGIDFRNNLLYVANSGSDNGAPGRAVVVYDLNANVVNTWTNVGNPFDVLAVDRISGADFLVNDIGGTPDAINKFLADGTFNGAFNNTAGFNFPEQITQRAANGNVLLASFSSPSQIWEFDTAGLLAATYDVGLSGLRGVHELGNNSKIMFTTGGGVFVLDTDGGGRVTEVLGGVSGQYIEWSSLPAPGSLALLGFGSLAAATRRRRR